MVEQKTYIAETDEDGCIEWVWLADTARLSARPFDPSRDKFDPEEPADFQGSGQMAIMSWLAAAGVLQEALPREQRVVIRKKDRRVYFGMNGLLEMGD